MKEFTLLGTTLHYSTQRMNYYSMHPVFLDLAKKSWQQFYTAYQKMGSLTKACEQLPKVMIQLVDHIDSACEEYIKLQEIYCVDAKDVGAHCNAALHELQQIYQERIVNPCEAIEEKKKAEAAHREFKKKVKSNDLWDSLGYTAINAVGNLGSSLSASLDAGSVYKNSDTLDQFKNAIIDYVLLAEHATIRLIQKNSRIAYDVPDSEETEKLQKITDNLLKGAIPAEKQDELILCVLQGDPHAFELYDLLVAKHGDEDGTLQDMAECFGYAEFTAHKLDLLDKKFAKALSTTYTEEQDIFDLEKQIKAYAAHLGVDPEKPLVQLKAQWDVIDRNLRTAGGKEYETREEAQNVRDDIELRNQKAAQYDLSKVNLIDPVQIDRFIEILRALPYKSTDIPNGLPDFVASITQRAARRCAVIESVADPDTLPGELAAAWAKFPIYAKIAGKLKFGADGAELLRKYANKWAPQPSEKLCLCQDISKLMSPGKVLVLTSCQLCLILNKEVAQFELDQIQSIQHQGSQCTLLLKDQPPYQMPFLVPLAGNEMDTYVRLLNDTIEGLQLTGVPREQIYVSIDSEEAIAAQPQPLTEDAVPTPPITVSTSPTPSSPVTSSPLDGKASPEEQKRLAYAKALAACGGTPDGILAAYESAKAENEAASKAYEQELAKNPRAKIANLLSMLFLLCALPGIALIFLGFLPLGLGVIVVSLLLCYFFDKRENSTMAASSSAEARQAKLRKEQAAEAFEVCKAYLNAKKEADESGITPDAVQELMEGQPQ